MEIKLDGVGKRFNKDWIFRHLSFIVENGSALAVQGHNGSGKSTFLKLLLGYVVPSEGSIIYGLDKTDPPYKSIGFASPYLDLFEDLTLSETLDFNASFKGFIDGYKTVDILEKLGFEKIGDRLLRNFSSGMLQRVKLALAIFGDVELILLDEPCSNLDKKGIDWYNNQILNYKKDRTIVVCSNQQEEEFSFCTKSINIQDFKV